MDRSYRQGAFTRQELVAAEYAAQSGNPLVVEAIAYKALSRSLDSGNRHHRADACLLLSRASVMTSRFRQALDFGAEAATYFKQAGNLVGQAKAAAAINYTASVLELNSVAEEAGELGCLLSENSADDEPAWACLFNHLGVASIWARDYATAEKHFEAAIWYSSDERSFQPLINYTATEALMLYKARREGAAGEPDRLLHRIARCRRQVGLGHVGNIAWGSGAIELALLEFFNVFAQLSLNNTDGAMRALEACHGWTRQFPAGSWVHAIHWWARTEIALAWRDVKEAADCAARMFLAGIHGQHLAIAYLGKTLLDDLYPPTDLEDQRLH